MNEQQHHLQQLIDRTLALDLETTRSGGRIRRIGAVFREQAYEWSGNGALREALARLQDFGRQAAYVLGHNLFNHDWPLLKGVAPGLGLLELPVIDTLFLSPLAFPRNPYHRLVKDYKLVRACLSDPLEDVRLALTVFEDQWAAFERQRREHPDLPAFYRFCFQQSRFNGFSGRGVADVFKLLGAAALEGAAQATAVFKALAQDRGCRSAMDGDVLGELLAAGEDAPVAAYALAWLRVAGSNSVLPPWVRHQFPRVVPLLAALRDTPCGQVQCGYCRRTHDPDAQLKRFFGFPAFRPQPAAADGGSLQRAVVLRGLQNRPLLAVLPTGGGKSLCFQLPALVRHMRRGLLTVVISPLQALMKDQVDNLVRNTGTPFAGAVYGLLTPPERGEVLERVRLGDIAILYIAPEQLRSRSVRAVLAQREIGCWVFDEAHCLSKWGHDFRPDYMYAARFIREFAQEQHLPLPPVACYTATAKPDVIEEITNYFKAELHQDLQLFAGGVERDNLNFDILPVGAAQKPAQTLELVRPYLEADPPAGVIVYAARRRTTEEVRDYLVHQGVAAEAFHGGLESNAKRRIIEAFVSGQIPVICATNAFGMGIDKENIRLVLHYDIPGSLENYLQEAGRAGRDLQPAHCMLLYDPEDAETQFKLGAYGEIRREEIRRILKCLRRGKKNRNNEIVITPQELLREEELTDVFDRGDRTNDTKVRTAVSWLERADFLRRDQNLTQVFQGKPLVRSLEAAGERIEKLDLAPYVRNLWRGILAAMFNAPPDQGLGADDIAESLFGSAETLKRLERQTGLTAAQMVIHAMHDMAVAGLLDQGMLLSAFVQPKGRNNAMERLQALCTLEERLLKFLREEAPDADAGTWLELDLSRVNQRLRNAGEEGSNPVTLRNLVKGLAYDGEGLAGSHGSIELQHVSRNRYRVALRRTWTALMETAALRRDVARLIVRELTAKARKELLPSGPGAAGDLLVSFSANDITGAIAHDLLLHSTVRNPLAALDRGLMFLHEHKVITLQNGLAVFRQAMTIRLNSEAARRRYNKGDFQPLKVHYGERRFQVHVMMEYARLAMDKIAHALGLILDYFAMPRDGFAAKYFAGREAILARATGAESYRRIVESLDHPVQIGIVGSPVQANQLILAGPGSGKTRVVVHRCAYLLRVERVPAHRILVMCFNHNAAVSLRKRLHELAGPDARGITVATYHGAAMRLAGISLRALMEHQGPAAIDFDALVRDATALLRGETVAPGVDPHELREHLLQGFSHILVDEYQDVDQDQYELIAAIAGRTLEAGDGRLALMAVGDDDQNIYTFRGANVEFIRRFQQDYGAHAVYMVENFRSSAYIIQAANDLIAHNRDRMKQDHPIRADRHRRDHPPGGRWESLDPLGRGRVQRLLVADPHHQAVAVFHELLRLKSLKPDLGWSQCAVLARTNQTLAFLRTLCEARHVPIQRGLERGLPLHRIREVDRYLAALKAMEHETRSASRLDERLPAAPSGTMAGLWTGLLADLHAAYRLETDDAVLPVSYYVDWLYEALAEQRREKTLGRGIFLNTVHGAKGLEFDHVFILDGDWRRPSRRQKQEEERRLLYVGMTRAKETLCLLELASQGNPLLRELKGDGILRRSAPAGDSATPTMPARQYHILGLSDLYLGYAGTFAPAHPIHAHLAGIGPGDRLRLMENQDSIQVLDPTGFCIAMLSSTGTPKWIRELARIKEVRVLGMVRWTVDDSREAYRHLANAPSWELPLLEVVTGNG
jgi:ATP-dependent DNA helicase RecQ